MILNHQQCLIQFNFYWFTKAFFRKVTAHYCTKPMQRKGIVTLKTEMMLQEQRLGQLAMDALTYYI